MWALNEFWRYGRLRALEWKPAETNLRCAESRSIYIPNPEISVFIRTDGHGMIDSTCDADQEYKGCAISSFGIETRNINNWTFTFVERWACEGTFWKRQFSTIWAMNHLTPKERVKVVTLLIENRCSSVKTQLAYRRKYIYRGIGIIGVVYFN